MALGSGGVTEPRDQLGKLRSRVQHCVAGIETSHGWTAAGHLAGGGAEARCIVGDIISLPVLLFDKVVVVAPDTRKEGEALDKAPPSLSCRDVELDVHRFLDVPAVGGNFHHHSGLKAERDRHSSRMEMRGNESEHTDVCVLMYYNLFNLIF